MSLRSRFNEAMRSGQNLSASGGLPHGHVAEKTNPGASAYAPEGTEKKPIVFRSRGVMQRPLFIMVKKSIDQGK